MKHWDKYIWRLYCERLSLKASTISGCTIEWINLQKRIKWIKENRCY